MASLTVTEFTVKPEEVVKDSAREFCFTVPFTEMGICVLSNAKNMPFKCGTTYSEWRQYGRR